MCLWLFWPQSVSHVFGKAAGQPSLISARPLACLRLLVAVLALSTGHSIDKSTHPSVRCTAVTDMQSSMPRQLNLPPTVAKQTYSICREWSAAVQHAVQNI